MTGQTKFDAKDAIKMHASAQAAAAGGWTKEQKIGYTIWGVIAFIVLAAVFSGNSNTPPTPSAPAAAPTQQATAAPDTSGPRTMPATLHEDTRKKMALVINLGGELCARVDSIRRIEGDTYAVSCTRYRDGTGSAVYEVNAATGQVK